MACTGPTTEAGKAISSQNALKTGATSRAAVLPWEDQQEYEALVADTISRCRPHGERELELARLVATTFWRYLRLLRVEAEFMASADEDGTRPDLAVANLFCDPQGAAKLRLMLRYVANASREYRAACTELRRVQTERTEQAGAAAVVPPLPVRTAPAQPRAEAHDDQPAAPPEPLMNRAERRALERAQRKAEKKARQSAWSHGQLPSEFVSYSLPEAA